MVMFGTARSSRVALLTSVATASLFASTAASAQTAPEGSYLQAQNSPPATSIVAPGVVPVGSILEPQVVSSPGKSPTAPAGPGSSQDPNDVTGIGEMIIDQQNGFIGLCTGTLINPRTVIFASHCVNENPDETAFQDPWGYGAASGGLPIAFGFRQNNNAAGNSAFGNWLFGGYQTNVANYLYNVNQVSYNPASTQLGLGNNFLQGDVAIATLDTPAANVPTWAILLSQLPAPGSINGATGTGYHVTIEGYGDSGTGNTGDTRAVDYRRRVAENYIGILGSLDDQDSFLFGAPDGLPQNLYQLDFDDPRRGTLNASVYDFNVFKDDAARDANGNSVEGITAPGDSGGPLILDNTFNQKLVIAVLSGGDRFFGAQRSASYGTTSFYQPLYLFWDWIAANNNYHYVGSKAGDGKWSDPTHWVTNIDPSYMTIVGGQLVNGVPTTLGDGINGTSGKFGEVCIEQGTSSDCYNIATGLETYTTGGVTQTFQYTPGSGPAGTNPLPTATLDNGLPGATNFVPNDRDPNAATHTRAAYFDVTLGATGTTTLDTAVTVDRLSITGSGAQFNITSAGSLKSLIDITQSNGLVNIDGSLSSVGDYYLAGGKMNVNSAGSLNTTLDVLQVGGLMNVDGTLNVARDYLLMSGGLSGIGRINTPFLTSLTGMIAPGTTSTIGTLTVGGNLILSSGNVFLVNLGSAGTSDKLVVAATQFDVNNVALNGIASIGGSVLFSPVAGGMVRAGDTFTILTAAHVDSNTTTKKFTSVPLSAILTPRFIYSANAVQVIIDAGLYANVVSSTSPVQGAYASLLDGDRASSYGNLSGLYGVLDLQSAATIQSTLEGLAPRTETLKDSMGTAAVDNMARFYRERVQSLHTGNLGGTLAVIGKPFQMASNAINALPGANEVRSDAGDTVMEQGKLPDTMSAFLAGGYLNGKGQPMPTAIPAGGRDRFDGFFIGGGLETELGEHGVIGFALSYTDLDGDTTIGTQTARGELYQGTIYGKLEGPAGLYLDTTVSAGILDSHTVRNVGIAGTTYRLTATDNSLTFSGEVGVGKNFDLGSIQFGPRASFRSSYIGFSTVAESGGGPALTIVRNGLRSNQGRIGATLSGGGMIKPFVSAYYVHDFDNAATGFSANFVGGLGPNATFALAGNDKDWEEVSGGLTISTGKVDLSVSADTTLDRADVSNQSYRGTIAFHF